MRWGGKGAKGKEVLVVVEKGKEDHIPIITECSIKGEEKLKRAHRMQQIPAQSWGGIRSSCPQKPLGALENSTVFQNSNGNDRQVSARWCHEKLTLEIPAGSAILVTNGKSESHRMDAAAAHFREEGPLTRPGTPGLFSSPQSSLAVQCV